MSETEGSLRTVAKGTATLTAFQFASKPLFAVFFILLGNRALFSEHDYGRLEALLTLANVFFILADLGLEPFVTRELARDRERTSSILPRLISLKLVLTLLTTLLLVVAVLVGVSDSEERSIGVLVGCALFMMALSAQSFARSVARAHDRMEVEGLMGVFEKIFTLAIGGFALWLGGSLFGVMTAFALGSALAAAWGLWRIGRYQSSLHPGWPPAFNIVRLSLPFALTSICVLLFYYMDQLMLFFYGGDVWVARYARSRRILMALLLFPQMLSIALYPTLARLKYDPKGRVDIGRKSLSAVLFLALPLVTGGWAVAGPLVDFLYRSADPGAMTWNWDSSLGWDSAVHNTTEAAVLRILLLSLPFIGCNYLFGPALNAQDKQGWNLNASLAALVGNLVLNFLFIPQLGPVGAALATTLTQMIYCLAMYAYLRRLDGSWMDFGRLSKILAASLAIAFLAIALSSLQAMIPIFCAAVVYVGISGLFGILPKFRDLKRNADPPDRLQP